MKYRSIILVTLTAFMAVFLWAGIGWSVAGEDPACADCHEYHARIAKPLTTTTAYSSTTTQPLITTTTTLQTSTTVPKTSTTIASIIYTSPVKLTSDLNIANAFFTQSGSVSGTVGLYGAGVSDVSLVDISASNLDKFLKVGSGAQSYRLNVNGMSGTNIWVGFFAANLSDSSFTNLDFALTDSETLDHPIYLERGLHNLIFRNLKLTGGLGYGLHMYNYEHQDQPSDNVLIENVEIDRKNRAPILISSGWSKITIRGLKATGPSSYPIIRLYGSPSEILIEDFEAWGGSALIDVVKSGQPVNVVLRNGVYHGSELGSSSGVTFENVRLEP